MNEINPLDLLIRLLIMLLLLRVWMQLARVDYYNPVTVKFVAVLRPAIHVLELVFRPVGHLNTAALVAGYSVAFVYLWWAFPGLPIIAIAITALALAVSIALSLLFWVLLAMVICSWVISPDNPWFQLIQQLMRPILSPVQRVIPNFGGIDFSPIVVFLGIQIIRGIVETQLLALGSSFAV